MRSALADSVGFVLTWNAETPLNGSYLTTQRLLLAKRLLTDTTLPVTQVALSAGFGSLRRFNAVFLERYRMNPTALRRERAQPPRADGATLRLAYRPPYDVAGVLGFFRTRAIPGLRRSKGWSCGEPLPSATKGPC